MIRQQILDALERQRAERKKKALRNENDQKVR
jgi:hypothetical protein